MSQDNSKPAQDKILSPRPLKDAWFFVAIFGRGQTSKLVRTWDALCDEVVRAFYGADATPAMRAVALKFLTNWDDWVFDFSQLPFNKIMQGDNGVGVEVFRIVETRNFTGTENADQNKN